jgi:hypothetical protein
MEGRVMRVLRKVLPVLVVLAVLYGIFGIVERLTVQELTRATEAATQESICLMWKPRLLRGDGRCYLDLQNAQGQVIDTAQLGFLSAGFDALQQFGNLSFQDQSVTVGSRQNSESVRRFLVREGRLEPAE